MTKGDDAKLAERRGQFTFGSKFIWWLPEGDECQKVAQCMPGKEDSPEWHEFAEKVCDVLNAALRHPHQPQGGVPSEVQGEELAGRDEPTEQEIEAAARQISPNCYWDNPPNSHQQRRCDNARTKARNALYAAAQTRPPHQQGGMASETKIAPLEPTNEQICAALEWSLEWMKKHGITALSPFSEYPQPGKTAAGMYRAMLAALPSPQAAGVDELITELREQAQGFCKATAGTMLATSGPPKIVMLLNKAADALAALTPLPAGGLSDLLDELKAIQKTAIAGFRGDQDEDGALSEINNRTLSLMEKLRG